MELSWSTFILELINFLVLVWILKRFLYRPVLDAIAKRKAAVEKTLADAETTRKQAEDMQSQYENRLADWDKEKEEAHAQLQTELNAERKRLTESLQKELDTEREKARAQAEHEQQTRVRRCEEAAVEQASRFTSRLLKDLACPELERQLFELTLKQLDKLTDDQRRALDKARESAQGTIDVACAFPLPDTQRGALAEALAKVLGKDAASVSLEVQQDPQLIAGLRISIGPWVLRANLQDELAAFTEAAHDNG